jgi:hypothetical protein
MVRVSKTKFPINATVDFRVIQFVEGVVKANPRTPISHVYNRLLLEAIEARQGERSLLQRLEDIEDAVRKTSAGLNALQAERHKGPDSPGFIAWRAMAERIFNEAKRTRNDRRSEEDTRDSEEGASGGETLS